MVPQTSSCNPRLKYDVFLSFSGGDTRRGFTNTLYDFLKTKGIDVFIDDGLPRGEQIEPSLMRTIKESMIAVVIFSKKYASSSWCLDELLKIVECCPVILPIFYEVDPFHVEKQEGEFGDQFATLKCTTNKSKIQKWKDALSFVATQSGWDLANYRTEIDLIKKVVDFIIQKLDSVSSFNVSPGFIGIASLVDEVQKLLNNDPSHVQFLGIWGMGGLGKTTVAEIVYHRLSKQFDACYFAANVRHESSNRLVTLRDNIFSKFLGKDYREGTPNQPHDYVIWRLQKMKVLIVLDNVSSSNQVATLVGTKANSWFDRGSKVIVTSRDSSVFKSEGMTVVEVKKMNAHYSLRLFCLNAFKQNQPPKDYVELSQQIVNYANGIPLALKVLGSHLHLRKKEDWVSTLKKLEGPLEKEIEEVLKISYYDLDRKEKMIFLDIACFFKGDDKDRVKDILDGCGFPAGIGIIRLIEKCLVTISVDNKLGMHDLIQKMGWEIAEQRTSPDFGRRSRFWTPNDCYNVLTSYSEAKAIEGIFLDMDKMEKFEIDPMAFSRMKNIRLLKFEQNAFSFDGFQESRNDGIQFLPNSLRFLHWDRYPYESLPLNFSAENVVELNLHNSKLKHLWNGVEYSIKLKRLKVLSLQGSELLSELPDLTSATNLEKIILDECVSLLEIPTSIQHLRSLSYLSLRSCINLHSLPSLVNLTTLRTVDLCRCLNLKKFPETPMNIEVLNLEETAIVDWPQSMSSLNNLKTLYINWGIQSLPRIMHLSSLNTLTLNGCSKLHKFPKIIGNLQKLNLERSGIKELPSSIVLLSSLVELNLKSCEELERLPNNFGQLNCLKKLTLSFCSELFSKPFTLSGLSSIKELYLQGCGLKEIPAWLSTLTSLQVLDLSCNCFDSLPECIKQLTLLEVLCVTDCTGLESVMELPNQMNDLVMGDCTSLKVASSSIIAHWTQSKQQDADDNFPSCRFCFGGCNHLGQDARRNIVTKALVRIQHIANSRREDMRFPLRVSLPSTDIPDYFHQCEGSSIEVQLPVNWCNTLFRGFVFSFTARTTSFGISLGTQTGSITYSCRFRSNDGGSLGSCLASFTFDEWEVESLRSKTLILQYSGDVYSSTIGNQFCKEKHKDATNATFHVWSSFSVLNCGVHLVYAQVEEEQSNPSTVETVSVGNKRESDHASTRLIISRRSSYWEEYVHNGKGLASLLAEIKE